MNMRLRASLTITSGSSQKLSDRWMSKEAKSGERKRGQPRLGYYASEIVKICGCSEVEAQIVEDIMRNDVFHSTLDWQTHEQYRAGAIEAFEALNEMRALGTLPETYQRLLRGEERRG